MEEPPPYSLTRFNIPVSSVGRMKKYIFRKDVHIFLLENGELYVQGEGMVYKKDKIILITYDQPLMLSCNISDIEAYKYYNFNDSPKDKFAIYGSDGEVILYPGKNYNCTLL